MQELVERLGRGEVVILDGAMGTELERRGVPMDRVAWSGAAIATHSLELARSMDRTLRLDDGHVV